LSSLPAGWSAGATFTCAQVSTGTTCQLPLTFAPTAAASGTLVLAYAYNDNAGTAKTGTINVPYIAQSKHLYVADQAAGTIDECSIGANGMLTSCTAAAAGLSDPFGISFYGSGSVYLTAASEVDFCSVNVDGSLANCSSVQGGYNGIAGFLIVNGSYLYVANINSFGGPQYCSIQPDGSLGGCPSSNGAASNNQATGVAFYGQYAYVSTVGDQNQPGIRLCELQIDGSLTNCADAGSGLQAASNVVTDDKGNIYAAAGGTISHCTVGIAGALGGCQALLGISIPQGDLLYYNGGFALYGGYAYIAYDDYNPNSGNDTEGIAVCSVASDGSFSSCTDSGQTFSSTVGLAVH